MLSITCKLLVETVKVVTMFLDTFQLFCRNFILSGCMADRLWGINSTNNMLERHPAFVISSWPGQFCVSTFHECNKNIAVCIRTFYNVSYVPVVVIDAGNVRTRLKSTRIYYNIRLSRLSLCFIQYYATVQFI